MENELTSILGRKVDMRTAEDISRYFRNEVIESAEVKYAEGWFNTSSSYAGFRKRSSLNTDRKLALALVKCIEIVGEAAANVSKQCREELQQIPWANIIGMRNRLIHAYFEINFDILWKTVVEDLPPLISELEKIVPPKDNK